MSQLLNLENIDVPIKLRAVGEAIPGDMRPLWRIAVILLVLRMGSTAQTASVEKVQVANWMLRQPSRWNEFAAILSGQLPLFRFNVQFDPFIQRALNFAIGEKLIDFTDSKRLILTPLGVSVSSQIAESNDTLKPELEFLRSIKKNFNEAKIKSLLQWGAAT